MQDGEDAQEVATRLRLSGVWPGGRGRAVAVRVGRTRPPGGRPGLRRAGVGR